MKQITWVLEPFVFYETHEPLVAAIRRAGHRLVEWSDSWLLDGVPRTVPVAEVIFHGSLGNAAVVHEELKWRPGSFCPVQLFYCSIWYNDAAAWLANQNWECCPADDFIRDARLIAERLDSSGRLFVRPDSPLKPFSGRVIDPASVTMKHLDFGFYFDDPKISVIAAPLREIGREWRFVVVDREVVTGCEYDSSTRSGRTEGLDTEAASVAAEIAREFSAPTRVYVLDICEADGELRLLEINPFGGADLYNCSAAEIVDAVSAVALK